MKRMGYVFLAEAVLAGMLALWPVRKLNPWATMPAASARTRSRRPAKKYDNDNLPTSDKISIVGNATESSPDDANAASTPVDSSAQPKQDAGKPADSSDAHKANDEWKQKISEQQAKVDMLTREVDVTQREYRLRAAAFYADAGNRLRNQGAWDKEDAQYNRTGQKQRHSMMRRKLDDLKEKARKAGVPAKYAAAVQAGGLSFAGGCSGRRCHLLDVMAPGQGFRHCRLSAGRAWMVRIDARP
jgi:hypothetical protein